MNTTESFNHKVAKTADEDFLQQLRDYLGGAETPIFYKADGSIDREKTLEQPCYWNFKDSSL
ncbi:MAG TPA: hypothetical protein VHV32_19445 [Candidatus Angelobacter sp.]|jgi:hypothetical protein|nr:hypothetical protein [Candidatus Angelobacter sp.]